MIVTVAGCAAFDTDDGTDRATGGGTEGGIDGSQDGSFVTAAPTTTLPLTKTPEYVASNTQCPGGLIELDAQPITEAAPGRTVSLVPYLALSEATVMTFDADGSPNGFVGDRRGRIWRFFADTTSADAFAVEATLSESPVADFSSDTSAEHDQGLVGMTLGPHGRLWINRTNRHGTSVLTVLTPTADGDALEGRFTDMLEVAQPSAQHNGGDVVFGPEGALYVSFGDGGGLGDPRHHGQNLASPLGAVLRFDVDTNDSDSTDDWRLVPAAGNPDLGPLSDPSIWAYGARNPYRMSFDPQTDDLWIADVGQQCVEEVTVLGLSEGGANLGWNSWEGSRRFVGPEISNHRLPDLEYRHGRGLCAVVGGHVYRGSRLAWLQGRYVFADLCGGDVYAAAVNQGRMPDVVWNLGVATTRPVGFAVDTQGELYVIDIESGVYRLDG